MKISEIYSAMGLKIRFNYKDSSAGFRAGSLIKIEPSQEREVFFVSQYGKGTENSSKMVRCNVSPNTADYLLDLFEGEQEKVFRCMFLIDGVEKECIEVQAYIFRSVTEYKTPIDIIVSDKLLEKRTIEELKQDYVWEQLGMPALFCLNYKDKKKQNANLRFVGGRHYLVAQNTPRGIFAEKISYLKDKYDVPVDIFVAPEIRFVPSSDLAKVNNELSKDLEKISNPASYFARWEAYDELSKKLLDVESDEFGELSYSSVQIKTEVNGTTYEFIIDQELDDSFIGKEAGVSEGETAEELFDKTTKHKKLTDVGQIKKINQNNITTFFDGGENIDQIPAKGIMKLYTAGDRYIMARRKAARDRMMDHKAPIKNIVALIETGASEFELMNSWGTYTAVTKEFKRNFKGADDLNQEQISAIDMAINTPDIALIQGPPGTGKTTVIKAIAERFREIFEEDQKQRQKADPRHFLRSPKILISSFQNEAVDNAISAPLPGDMPAYRKTAKKTTESSKEQYQRSLENWYLSLKNEITNMIEVDIAPQYIENKRKLDDEFLSYKNAGEPIDMAAALIDHYLSYVEISYPEDLVEKAKCILAAASAASCDDDYEDPIIKRIKAQRITPEEFEDDGARNAGRLAAYIRINSDLEVSEEILEAIQTVSDGEYTAEEFESYVHAVDALRTRFCKNCMTIDPTDKGAINECILNLANAFSGHYINTLSSIQGKKSLILSDFLSRLEQDYETIVKKYSMTTAATCQTSLDLSEDENKTYDLVIVDEAARANPLDLFIPMSMGRKIILVGDHKQLPHMLEPDVLKLLEEDPRFKDISEIEKSLFERLFEMFSKGRKPKAIQLTKQFRMHPEICRFVSEAFYDNVLETDASITSEIRASSPEINEGRALAFINVTISRGAEKPGVSKSRLAEVEIIEKDVSHILKADPESSIGIITFYSAQSQMIKNHLDRLLNDEERNHIEVGTVDAFQGKEFDYVLLSCVRSNKPKDGGASDVGFLKKENRLCVAFSRSVRQLAVYGDADTLKQIPCFSRLYDICKVEKGGCYREY